MNFSVRTFNIKKYAGLRFVLYIFYVALTFTLAYVIWPKYATSQFSAYHYILDYSFWKLVLGISLAIIVCTFAYILYSDDKSFSGRVLYFLSMLYFIPGIAVISALNLSLDYILVYLAYYFVMVLANILFSKPTKAPMSIKESHGKLVFWFLVVLALLYPFVMSLVYNRSFSFSEFLMTYNDPYGMRAQAREHDISWAFLLIENWGVYFGALLITFFIKNKRYALTTVFIIIEAFYFSLQGNRIFIFITGIALLLGIFDVKDKLLPYIFIGLLGFQVLEYLLFQNLENLGFIMNVFRRFSIVPNIISTYYYDYFLTAVPDYLRDYFPSISRMLGTTSPYGVNVGYIIGQKYLGMYLNANTGLVGGALFEFGIPGVVIDPIMLVLSFRVFEKVLFSADNEITFLSAFIYSSLAINSWSIWAQFVRISYIPLLIISIYILVTIEGYESSLNLLTRKKIKITFGGNHGHYS